MISKISIITEASVGPRFVCLEVPLAQALNGHVANLKFTFVLAFKTMLI